MSSEYPACCLDSWMVMGWGWGTKVAQSTLHSVTRATQPQGGCLWGLAAIAGSLG